MNSIIKNPLVSIVIPVYNSEKYLPAAMESLVNQTYRNLEIIIIDNGSSGNVKDIFLEYEKQYPELRWVFYSFEKNVGWYNAVIKGYSIMTGEYFAEMDSDDIISIDYIYQLLNTAITENSDIVSTDYVHLVEGQGFMHYSMNDMECCDFCWTGSDVLSKFMEARGRSFTYHAPWCKIYKYHIWTKSRDFLESIDENIPEGADVLICGVFAGNADKWVNIHHAHYYHRVYPTSTTEALSSSKEKLMESFDNVDVCFACLKKYLISISRFDELREYFDDYRKFFASLKFTKVKYSNFSSKKLYQYGCNKLNLEEPVFIESMGYLMESQISPFNNSLEDIRKAIMDNDIKVISFDIFDTLIERPFARPEDTFQFLSEKYNQMKPGAKFIEFANLRQCAEQIAFEKNRHHHPYYYDITLDQIYEELVYEGVLSSDEAKELMEYEIELEYRFCKARNIGKYIFDFAVRSKKTIICMSDMYLSKEVIANILNQNGYYCIDRIYVSSEEKVCKSDGKLQRKILSDYNIKGSQIYHIGDNFATDYNESMRVGYKVGYLGSSRDLLAGVNGFTYSGHSFQNIFKSYYEQLGGMSYLGTRCMLGVVANKVYGNPFVSFDPSSEFDCNPNIIGYYLFGTYVFTVAKWLLDRASTGGYDTIHFVARDGYVFKQAYDILAAKSGKKCPKSNYLIISRSAMMPLLVQSKRDLFAIRQLMPSQSMTPLLFIDKMKQVIPNSVYENREQILRNCGIVSDEIIDSNEQWSEFIRVYAKYFYNEKCIKEYRETYKSVFGKILGNHDCTFDVGYSSRNETMLHEALGVNLDTFYLCVREERAIKQAKYIGMNIEYFHNCLFENGLQTILETIICATDECCDSYNFVDGTVKYVFDGKKFNSQTTFILDLIHQRAVEFVSDFISIFPEWENLNYRDGEKPFLYYIYHATDFDKGILRKIMWHDPLCLTEDMDFSSLWKSQPYTGPGAVNAPVITQVVGVKGALVNYFKKNTPEWLRPAAKRIKKMLKW